MSSSADSRHDQTAADVSRSGSGTTSQTNSTEVVYYLEPDPEGYLTRIPIAPDCITLQHLKNALARSQGTKFFFKSHAEDLGTVKEEISEPTARLPLHNGRVVCFLVATTDASSTHSSAPRPAPPSDASEGESIVSGLPHFPKNQGRNHRRLPRARRPPRRQYDTSDDDTTSYLYSGLDDVASCASTDITSVSRQQRRRQPRVQQYTRRMPSRASSLTSITESSMSLNIIAVSLNMATVPYVGLSIMGYNADDGIYVAKIAPGGAVDRDGRIAIGDLILAVNDVYFDTLTNSEAEKVLSNAVHDAVARRGVLRLTVAKPCDAAGGDTTDYYAPFPMPAPPNETQPIDLGAWVAHTNALLGTGNAPPVPPPGSAPPDPPQLPPGPPSYQPPQSAMSGGPTPVLRQMSLHVHTCSPRDVIAAVVSPDSTLVVKDRTWLKICIPEAFLGSELVEWLLNNVEGIAERKAARKYASNLLKEGFIRHSVNKSSFSEKTIYTFTSNAYSTLPLGSQQLPNQGQGAPPCDPPPQPPPSVLTQSPRRTAVTGSTTDSGTMVSNGHGPPPTDPAGCAMQQHNNELQMQQQSLLVDLDDLSVSRQSYRYAMRNLVQQPTGHAV